MIVSYKLYWNFFSANDVRNPPTKRMGMYFSKNKIMVLLCWVVNDHGRARNLAEHGAVGLTGNLGCRRYGLACAFRKGVSAGTGKNNLTS